MIAFFQLCESDFIASSIVIALNGAVGILRVDSPSMCTTFDSSTSSDTPLGKTVFLGILPNLVALNILGFKGFRLFPSVGLLVIPTSVSTSSPVLALLLLNRYREPLLDLWEPLLDLWEPLLNLF